MFAPLAGIPEDPATGSAAAALAALLLHFDGGDALEVAISQGDEIGRPSRLRAGARREADGIRAWVGGGCVPVMEGRVSL
jgi:trans-2,3-dihydro-3-hydroxyanthranilate isomerase